VTAMTGVERALFKSGLKPTRHKQHLVNWRFSRRRLWASLALVGSKFLGNSWVKSGWCLPRRGWSIVRYKTNRLRRRHR
jgi:hypothetical protein